MPLNQKDILKKLERIEEAHKDLESLERALSDLMRKDPNETRSIRQFYDDKKKSLTDEMNKKWGEIIKALTKFPKDSIKKLTVPGYNEFSLYQHAMFVAMSTNTKETQAVDRLIHINKHNELTLEIPQEGMLNLKRYIEKSGFGRFGSVLNILNQNSKSTPIPPSRSAPLAASKEILKNSRVDSKTGASSLSLSKGTPKSQQGPLTPSLQPNPNLEEALRERKKRLANLLSDSDSNEVLPPPHPQQVQQAHVSVKDKGKSLGSAPTSQKRSSDPSKSMTNQKGYRDEDREARRRERMINAINLFVDPNRPVSPSQIETFKSIVIWSELRLTTEQCEKILENLVGTHSQEKQRFSHEKEETKEGEKITAFQRIFLTVLNSLKESSDPSEVKNNEEKRRLLKFIKENFSELKKNLNPEGVYYKDVLLDIMKRYGNLKGTVKNEETVKSETTPKKSAPPLPQQNVPGENVQEALALERRKRELAKRSSASDANEANKRGRSSTESNREPEQKQEEEIDPAVLPLPPPTPQQITKLAPDTPQKRESKEINSPKSTATSRSGGTNVSVRSAVKASLTVDDKDERKKITEAFSLLYNSGFTNTQIRKMMENSENVESLRGLMGGKYSEELRSAVLNIQEATPNILKECAAAAAKVKQAKQVQKYATDIFLWVFTRGIKQPDDVKNFNEILNLNGPSPTMQKGLDYLRKARKEYSKEIELALTGARSQYAKISVPLPPVLLPIELPENDPEEHSEEKVKIIAAYNLLYRSQFNRIEKIDSVDSEGKFKVRNFKNDIEKFMGPTYYNEELRDAVQVIIDHRDNKNLLNSCKNEFNIRIYAEKIFSQILDEGVAPEGMEQFFERSSRFAEASKFLKEYETEKKKAIEAVKNKFKNEHQSAEQLKKTAFKQSEPKVVEILPSTNVYSRYEHQEEEPESEESVTPADLRSSGFLGFSDIVTQPGTEPEALLLSQSQQLNRESKEGRKQSISNSVGKNVMQRNKDLESRTSKFGEKIQGSYKGKVPDEIHKQYSFLQELSKFLDREQIKDENGKDELSLGKKQSILLGAYCAILNKQSFSFKKSAFVIALDEEIGALRTGLLPFKDIPRADLKETKKNCLNLFNSCMGYIVGDTTLRNKFITQIQDVPRNDVEKFLPQITPSKKLNPNRSHPTV